MMHSKEFYTLLQFPFCTWRIPSRQICTTASSTNVIELPTWFWLAALLHYLSPLVMQSWSKRPQSMEHVHFFFALQLLGSYFSCHYAWLRSGSFSKRLMTRTTPCLWHDLPCYVTPCALFFIAESVPGRNGETQLPEASASLNWKCSKTSLVELEEIIDEVVFRSHMQKCVVRHAFSCKTKDIRI